MMTNLRWNTTDRMRPMPPKKFRWKIITSFTLSTFCSKSPPKSNEGFPRRSIVAAHFLTQLELMLIKSCHFSNTWWQWECLITSVLKSILKTVYSHLLQGGPVSGEGVVPHSSQPHICQSAVGQSWRHDRVMVEREREGVDGTEMMRGRV